MAVVVRFVVLALVAIVALASLGCANEVTLEIVGTGVVEVVELDTKCTTSPCVLEIADAVSFVAKPGEGFTFASWSGVCTETATAAVCKATFADDAQVTATFEPLVTVEVEVNGGGKLVSEDGKINCPEKCKTMVPKGTEVRIRSQSTTDTFAGFEGDCKARECVLIAQKNAKVIGNFTKPGGTVLFASVAAAHEGATAASIAFDEKGGAGVAVAGAKGVLVHRIDAAGASVFSTVVGLGSGVKSAGIAFFGDDLIVVGGDATASTGVRISPDGKTQRFNKLLRGCPGLERAVVAADGVFAAGEFTGSHSCGDKELIASGGADVVAVRLNIEDGSLVWAAQFGSGEKDALADLVVDGVEESLVGWRAGKDGGRVTRVNPAGKPFPDMELGKPSSGSDVLDLAIVKNRLRIVGHITQQTTFGTEVVGPPQKDGAKRLVSVTMDVDGRNPTGTLIARSTCDSKALCVFDDDGGFLRASTGNDASLEILRVGPDGSERWNARHRAEGKLTTLALARGNGAALAVAVLDGSVELPSGKLSSKQPSIVLVQLKD